MAAVHPKMYFNIEHQVTNLAFLSEDQILVGTCKGQIQLWSLKSETLSQTFDLFSEPILWIGKCQDFVLIQARFCRTIKILEKLKLKQEFEMTEDATSHFCKGDIFETKDKIIAALPAKESNCELLDCKNFKTLTVLQNDSAKEGFMSALKLSDQLLFLAFESGNIKVFCTQTFQVCPNRLLSVTKLTHSPLCLESQNKILVNSNAEDYLETHQIGEKGELTLLKKRSLPEKGSISSLKIRKDGKILAGGSWDSTLRLFSWLKPANLKPLGALKFHQKAIEAVAVTSKLIAAGSSDGYVTIWDVYNT